jgi:hypothetical protein
MECNQEWMIALGFTLVAGALVAVVLGKDSVVMNAKNSFFVLL